MQPLISRLQAKVWVAFSIIVEIAFSILPSFAQSAPDGLRLGDPRYGGSGCPQGSVSAALSPDARSLSLIFDQLTIQAGGTGSKSSAQTSCRVGVPISVPKGYQVALVKVDYRGFASIPNGGKGYLVVTGNYPGAQNQRYQKIFASSEDESFTVSSPNPNNSSYSACGQEVLFDSSITLSLQANAAFEESVLTLDTADLDAGATYELKWRTCSTGVQPQKPGSTGGDGRVPNRPGNQDRDCRVLQAKDSRGNTLFRVIDRQGRVLLAARTQDEALQFISRDSRCFSQ